MAEITLSQIQPFPAAHGYSTTGTTLRIWYGRTFQDSEGIDIQGGNGTAGFYVSSACTVVSGQITAANCQIWTTIDANDPAPQSIQCFARFFSNGTPKDWLFQGAGTPNGWIIYNPDPATTITFAALQLLNQAPYIQNPPQTFLTSAEVLALIEQVAGDFDFATVNSAGITRLSVAPALANVPIAVGTNDTRLPTQLDINALPVNPKDYGAIGTGATTTITTADVLAHSAGQRFPWAGTYTVGVDTKDYVGLQEAIYAAFYNGTLTPNNTNRKLNRILDWGSGDYRINKGLLITTLQGAVIYGAGNLTTTITCFAAEPCLAINGLWYSYFANFHMIGSVAHAGAVIQIEGTGISEQYTTWVNVFANGSSVVADGFALNALGGLQGDGNRWINCRAATCTVAGLHTKGSNTLSNQWVGGDMQGCTNKGFWADFGSTINVDSPTMENGANVADFYATGGVTQAKSSYRNVRSESKVSVISPTDTGPVEIDNVEAVGYGWANPTDWAALTPVLTTKYTIGTGRLFKITTAGITGAGEPNWDSVASDGGTIVDGSATWTQQEWDIVNVRNSSIENCVFGLGRVEQNWGNASLDNNVINNTIVTRVDWSGDLAGAQGGWLSVPAIEYFLGIQVRKITQLIPQWEATTPTVYGNRSQAGGWSGALQALQPTSVNPFFLGDGTVIFSKAVSAGLGYADVGIGHGAPSSGGDFSVTADANYLTQNTLAVWGTIAPGRIPVGSNQQGKDLLLQGGPSTGNLQSGKIYFRAGVAGAGGAQVNPTANIAHIDSTALASLKRFIQIEGSALTVGSNTIAPTHSIHQCGAGLIKTITVPSGFTSGTIALIPTAAFTYDATDNVLGTGTATIGRTMFATFSSSTSKWSMSY